MIPCDAALSINQQKSSCLYFHVHSTQMWNQFNSGIDGKFQYWNCLPYILAYKSIFLPSEKGVPRSIRLIYRSYFLPAKGKMFSAILDTQHYRVQPNKSQSRNKIVISLPTIRILRDFKPILTSTYTVSICPRKELQGEKLTSTYLLGRLIHMYKSI